MKIFEVFLIVLRSNLCASLNNRGEFFLKVIFMLVNNGIFLLLWLLLFDNYQTIQGWEFSHLIFMFGVSAFSFGVNIFLFYGLREIPQWVDSGVFDIFLTRPVDILLYPAMRSVNVSGLGDIIFGTLLILLSGFISLKTILPIAIILLVSCVLVFAINVLLCSLAFWINGSDGLIKQLYLNIIILASNPPSIYSSVLQIMIHSLIPIGLMTNLPILFIKSFDYSYLILMILGTNIFLYICVKIFYFSVKRHSSGNLFVTN